MFVTQQKKQRKKSFANCLATFFFHFFLYSGLGEFDSEIKVLLRHVLMTKGYCLQLVYITCFFKQYLHLLIVDIKRFAFTLNYKEKNLIFLNFKLID